MSGTSPRSVLIQRLTRRSVRRRIRLRLAAGLASVVTLALMALGGAPALADDPTPSTDASSGASPSATVGAHGKGTFVMGLKQDIDSLNPYVGVLASSFDAYQMMYDYLTDTSPKDLSVVPSLASSWDTSADGLTWTFHLRTGVKWSDGQDLTADDVVYSYQRVLAADSVENGQYGSSLGNVDKVEATNPTPSCSTPPSRARRCSGPPSPTACPSSRSTSGPT